MFVTVSVMCILRLFKLKQKAKQFYKHKTSPQSYKSQIKILTLVSLVGL